MTGSKSAPVVLSRGDVTRSRLIKAAARLFASQGYHATSMRDIAQAAGLAVAGIYNHFPNKEAIFAEVLDAHHPYHVVLPALEKAEGRSAETFIRDASETMRSEMQRAGPRLMPLIFTELVEFRGRHLRRLAERLMPTLTGFMERLAARSGELRPLPAPLMLRTLMALLAGFLVTEMILRTSPKLRGVKLDWYGGMMDIFLHGILAAPGQGRQRAHD